jgi:pyruvate dehydrogenase E2 component (dihydrolipoamide acetyltransferase)
VSALKQFPIVNSSLDDSTGEVVYKKYYNIGVALDTPDGLMVPVVKDAGQKTIFQIAADIERLSDAGKNRKIALEDLKDSTFTITSLGKTGGILATPIINWPEVAIMGVHKIKETPVVNNGKIEIGHVMNLSFSFDHRVVDGAVGAQFAQALIRYLEDPKLLLLDTM